MTISHEHAPGGDATFAHAGVRAERADAAHAHRGVRFGIAVARFNAGITDSLFAGAVAELLAAGVDASHIRAIQVPGAVELPLAAKDLIQAGCAAVIALGCVIRGETAHFEYVCRAATDGCMRLMLDTGVPVGFGVITAETTEQAQTRSVRPGAAAASGHNVGAHAALAALEILGVGRLLRN